MGAVRLKAPSREAVSRIQRLGLTERVVEYVGLAMVEGAASARALGVRIEAGFNRWAWGVAALGESLVPMGWSREGDLEGVTNPDRTIAIIVTKGDAGVGNMLQEVRASRPRGCLTRARVQSNYQLLYLPGFQPEPEALSDLPPILWMLLHHTTNGVLRLELSLPESIEENGRVIKWAERIPLGSYGLGDDTGDSLAFLDGDVPPSAPAPIRLVPKS